MPTDTPAVARTFTGSTTSVVVEADDELRALFGRAVEGRRAVNADDDGRRQNPGASEPGNAAAAGDGGRTLPLDVTRCSTSRSRVDVIMPSMVSPPPGDSGCEPPEP